MKIKIHISGAAGLIQHNIQLADPRNPWAKQMKQISGKRKKTDDDHEMLAELEFKGGLYLNDLGPYVPGQNVEKCIVEGARITKQGKQIERGLMIFDDYPLIYSGPRDADALWADSNFVHTAAVKVGQARVMRTRPIFRQWELLVEGEMDEGLLDLPVLQQIVDDAGRMVGLGDNRPRFGRFEATVTAA